jgi:hypothetical protein
VDTKISARGLFHSHGGNPVTEHRAKRKLTPILSADVKGYSRLMGEFGEPTIEKMQRSKKYFSDS